MGQALTTRRRQRQGAMTCHGAPTPPLEDDDILSMILLRLPPQPSSLPRVSVVCKRWRHLVTDPYFQHRFLAHHKKAPFLGFFFSLNGRVGFRPVLGPPNRIPGLRFSSQQLGQDHMILGCHHGRLLALNYKEQHFIVWDPITGDHHHVGIPRVFIYNEILGWNAAVICASQEKDHIHGACHAEPFQMVLTGSNNKGVFACVYSSIAGTWGSLISLLRQMPDIALHRLTVPPDCQSSLVGDSIYFLPVSLNGATLEFDLHTQTIAIIDAPPGAFNFNASINHQYQTCIVPADGGALSFIVLSGFSVHIWKRISSGAGWVYKNTVDLSNLLSLRPRGDGIDIQGALRILGPDGHDIVIFRSRDNGAAYMVHFETLQFKELCQNLGNNASYPFSSFYTAGMHPETGMCGDGNV